MPAAPTEQDIPRLLELRRTQNERLTVDKWNAQLPSTTLGGGAMPFINLPAGR